MKKIILLLGIIVFHFMGTASDLRKESTELTNQQSCKRHKGNAFIEMSMEPPRLQGVVSDGSQKFHRPAPPRDKFSKKQKLKLIKKVDVVQTVQNDSENFEKK